MQENAVYRVDASMRQDVPASYYHGEDRSQKRNISEIIKVLKVRPR